MMATESGMAKADWYADPMGRHQYRYWDGAVWTEHVADAGQASIDPLGQVSESASAAADDATVEEPIDHLAGGVVMTSGHYEGCKLVASVDAATGYVCAVEVQFKNALPSEELAAEALSAWRPALAAHSFIIRDSLVAQGWQTNRPFGSPYVVMDMMYAGHHIDDCSHASTDWKEIEP